jgi:methyltransferase type 11
MMVGVDNVFDAAARDFADLAPLLWDRVGAAVVNTVPPEDGTRVLDACCGVGSAALPAAELVGSTGRVDAIDLSTPLIEVLQNRLAGSLVADRVCPFASDITTWDGGPYDHVFCILGLPFLTDPAAGAAHLTGLLHPGGSLVIAHWLSSPESLDLPAVGTALAGILRKLGGTLPPPHAGRACFSNDLTRPETMRSRLETLGLSAEVTTIELRVPLDPRTLRLLVEGSAFRGMLADLDAASREQAHTLLAEQLSGRELDASLVVGVGQRQ